MVSEYITVKAAQKGRTESSGQGAFPLPRRSPAVPAWAWCAAPKVNSIKATPHNCVCGALRKFCPRILLRFLAIHQVLLRKRAASGCKIFSQIALAQLCGIALRIQSPNCFDPHSIALYKNVTICPRKQPSFGSKVVSLVPCVMPSLTAHCTASA